MKKLFLFSAANAIILNLVFSQGTAINTTGASADNSAILDVSSTTKGFVLPRMTTTDRNTIVSPVEGLQIFNTTTRCLEIYISPIWQTIYCGCSVPSTPAEGTHLPDQPQIEWNWSSAAGASGYKWNSVNDYNSAQDMGSDTTKTQTGVNCNTPYTSYVWAYNWCGNSSPVMLTATTLPCNNCTESSVNFTYRGSPVTYGTVSGQNGSCWLDRNLGATQVATGYNDAAAYGDLFQWGRLDDGHQLRTSSTTSTLSSTDVPGHSNFIYDVVPAYDWRDPKNDNLWQGVSGINNPCPSGWRLPLVSELDDERSNWAAGNKLVSAYNSSLKLTASGYKSASNGVVYQEAEVGAYWSYATDGTEVYALYYNDSGVWLTGGWARASAFSVRCIKD